ncbi:SMI1/KNR4 family protein [Flagellimonas amoyensis]|uniref:SMI1/KNR4 family protein n=1 Tax=Flagellimonas amoyensis TaxID=2169401 RepID=UPI000D3BDA80|nr:SMI1/KNR4 family protein [Allomuricauda amoyensis]
MTDFTEQIHRIKEKLVLAKKVDKHFSAFGAASHKYALDPPASIAEVEAFEKRYGIRLPEGYRAFVLNIGNGGASFHNSGAGPYYGIYPLGNYLDDLILKDKDVERHLKKTCMLFPGLSEKQWDKLTDPLYSEGISDADFAELNGTLYGGILPLGTQGCSYIHALVLSGPYCGRIVNMARSEQMEPRFSSGENFLDWYEQWLDEIISGNLIRNSPSWFGYPTN